jgi:hypothetical protein
MDKVTIIELGLLALIFFNTWTLARVVDRIEAKVNGLVAKGERN